MSTKVTTGKCRLSYVNLITPRAFNDQDPKFSVVLLIPKSDKATMKKLRAAEEEATQQGIASKWNGKKPKGMASIIKDGDEDADLETNPEYAGHWYMSVNSKNRPGVVDRSLEPILDATEIYSGCYGRAALNAYPYSANGNRGVTFGLNHVQKLAEGEPLGGVSRVEDVFDELDDEDDDDLGGVI